MIRVFAREVVLSLLVLALVVAAAWAVDTGAGPFVVPRGSPTSGLGPTPPARDLLYLLLALAGLGVVGRVVRQVALLRRLGYAPIAHILKALRRPLAHRLTALAGVALTVGDATAVVSPMATGAPSPVQPPTAHPARITALRGEPTSRPPEQRVRSSDPRPPRRIGRVRRRATHAPLVVGQALRYTVQPGDTISLVAARLDPTDPSLTARIWRASRTAPQPAALPAITDPHWIYPGQTLLVPLPLPHVSVSGHDILYIVQPGDDEGRIAAKLLGPWTRYRELVPVNAVVADDNVIQPGLVFRLPADALVMPYHQSPYRGLRYWRPARPAGRRVARQRPRPVLHPAPASIRRPARVRPKRGVHPRPAAGRGPRASGHPTHRSPRPQSLPTRRPPARPRLPQPQPVPRRGPAAPPLPTAGGLAHHLQPRPTRPAPPVLLTLRMPGEDRLLPLTFVVAFLGLCAVAATRTRRGTSTSASIAPSGVAPARRVRAIPTPATARCLADGARARFATLLGRAAVRRGGGAVVAHVVAVLAACGRAEGVSVDLAAATRRVTEGAATLDLLVEARHLDSDVLARVAARLATALATTVTMAAQLVVDADGAACHAVSVHTAGLAAPSHVAPHPAPLLIPVGKNGHGAVAHVNVARLDALLVAGEAYSAHILVGTLLASALVQASPATLRLLVATADDELRRALPAAYLDAPPADPDDAAALAGIVTQAHDLVSARLVAGDGVADGPRVLVLLDKIERLAQAPRVVDRLEAVCRNGRACGVHVIATTSAPAALAAAGVLPAFGGRLVRRLTEETSRVVWGDARAAALGEDEALLRAGPGPLPAGYTDPLVPFTLTPREVAQVLDTVATAANPEPPEDDVDAPPTIDGDVAAAAPGVGDNADSARGQAATAEGAVESAPDVTSVGASVDPPDAPPAGDAPRSLPTDTPAVAEPGPLVERPTATAAEVSAGTDAAPEVEADGSAAGAGEDDVGAFPVVVQLFGETSVAVGDTPVALYPRELRVLTLLALEAPRPVAAETIAETLFPDRDSAKGIDAVQKAVGEIRAALRRAGVSKRQTSAVIAFSSAGYALPLAHVDLDLARFGRLVRLAGTASRQERGTLLAEAAAVAARGDVCATEDMPEHRCEAWRKQVRAALYELVEHYERVEKAPVAALHIAQRLARLDPYNDHYHQEVLNLLEKVRDDAGVEAHYRAMRYDYADADIPMDPYTKVLMGQIRERRRARVGAARDEADVSHASPDEPTTLVG